MKPCIRFFAHPEHRPFEESRLVVVDIAKLVGGAVFDGVWGIARRFLP
ncbi:MAG: hypothetical protein WC054_11800 [Candidatus Nanopelagicales bacterium]